MIDNFRYSPIAATTIGADQTFIIAALLPSNLQDGYLVEPANTVNSYAVGGGSTFLVDADTLTLPTQNAHFTSAIANASTQTVPAVPELNTPAYAALAIDCFILLRRFCRTA